MSESTMELKLKHLIERTKSREAATTAIDILTTRTASAATTPLSPVQVAELLAKKLAEEESQQKAKIAAAKKSFVDAQEKVVRNMVEEGIKRDREEEKRRKANPDYGMFS